MKRYKSILLVLFSILACQSEINQNENTNENAISMSFYAGIEIPKNSSLTKTVLEGTSSDTFRNLLWENLDEVYVTNGGQSSKFINTNQGTSEIAFLEGELAEGANFFAAYPYDMVNSFSSYEMILDLPAVQTYYKDGIKSGTYPMVAICEDGVFNFKNLCGIFVVQLRGRKAILSITFSGKDSGGNPIPIAGNGNVSMNYSDAPSLIMNNSSLTQVTLKCPEAVALDDLNPTAFHIVLPVGIYSTFELIITADDGSKMIVNSNKELNIKRSTRTSTSALNFSQEDDYIDEYGINHGPGVEIDGVVWAPVNCGYHKDDFKYGKLYQWGRKYGQGYSGSLYDVNGSYVGRYSDAVVPTEVSGPVDLATGQSQANEDNFYNKKSSPYDWLSPQNDELWNSGTEENPIKTEYDPCPEGWRVPTFAELNGLIRNRSSWTSEGGQPGCWFSGASSYTENVPQVFFPAAGLSSYYDGYAINRGGYGFYWSSGTYDYDAYYLFFYSGGTDMDDYDNRAYRYSVRCVQDDATLIPVENITLSKSTLALSPGTSETLSSTITPSNANHRSAHWWSENPEVASVDKNGNVTAVSAGTTTIYAMAGMQVATCEVTVTGEPQERDYIDEYGINHGPGVEIDGVVWAPVNCGYHKDNFKYGKLYQWGRKYGQGYNGTLYDVSGSRVGKYSDAVVPTIVSGPVYYLATGQSQANEDNFYYRSSSPYDWLSPQNDELWNSGTESKPVKTDYDPCPEGWRVPTYAELKGLSSNRSSWTTDAKGQAGYWFSGASSYTKNVPQVFFPAAGHRDYIDGGADYRGYYGFYWSSRPNYTYASYLFFNSSDVDMGNHVRAYGYSVRCVQD